MERVNNSTNVNCKYCQAKLCCEAKLFCGVFFQNSFEIILRSCVLLRRAFNYRRGIRHKTFGKTSSITENFFLANQIDKMLISRHLAGPRLMAMAVDLFIVVCNPPRIHGRGARHTLQSAHNGEYMQYIF